MNSTSTLVRALAILIAGARLLAGQSSCGGSGRSYGDLGIGPYQCVRADCLFGSRNTHGAVDLFNVEPALGQIKRAAKSLIRNGDLLVAIDGHPIATPAGGARLATIRPDEPTTLVIRRDGRERIVQLTAVASCERPSIQITSLSAGLPAAVSRRELSAVNGQARVGDIQRSAVPTNVVGAVQPTLAEDLAGLRRGDVIVSVDEPTPSGAPRTFVITAVAIDSFGFRQLNWLQIPPE